VTFLHANSVSSTELSQTSRGKGDGTHVSCDQAQPLLSLALGPDRPPARLLISFSSSIPVPFSAPCSHWILTPYVCVSLLEECGNFTRPSTRDQFGDPKVLKLGSLQRQCMNLSHPIPLRARWIRYPALCPTLLVSFVVLARTLLTRSLILNTPVYPIF
jgi:hypothetical protein